MNLSIIQRMILLKNSSIGGNNMGTSFSLSQAIIQHLELTFVALFISIILGITIGIILHKMKSANKFISIISAIQTIPTLALLGFLVPILGIGKVPAIFVLIIYGSYPIIINTYSGLEQVDSEYIEISDALGMNENQKLFKVKLPLSMSIIMAGIRNGLVQIIGLATLTSLIGSGGLGDFIYRGINAMNSNLILMGAIPVTIIVLILSFFLKKIENNWQFFFHHKKQTLAITFVVVVCYLIVSLFSMMPNQKTITLASKDFTESGLLTTIMAELIEDKTDIKVEKKMYMGTTDILHKALVKGEIDGYVEYTGTSYLTVFNQTKNRDDMKEYVIDEYAKIGITAFDSLGVNNTFVLLQTKDFQKQYGIESISELSQYANKFTLSAYAEFVEREDGLQNLLDTYSLQFKDIKQLERSLGYKALDEGQVDFMVSFSTEPAIYKYQFQEVKDDKNMFMRYDALPLISTETLEKYPELKPIIQELCGKLNNETMSELNNDVENNQRKEIDVAREWLKEVHLIS